MSKAQCDACTDLRATSPEFVAFGVTDTVAASLMNNTGLNPNLTVLHEDCEDMADVVDCLIGRLKPKDLKSCDVPDFLDKLTGNMYETFKALNAVDCGLWEKVKLLDEILKLLQEIMDKLEECCDGPAADGCVENASALQYNDACPAPFWNSHEGQDPFLDGGVATRTVPENALIFLYNNQNCTLTYKKTGTTAVELLGHSYGSFTVTFPTATTMHMVNTNTEQVWGVLYLTFPE